MSEKRDTLIGQERIKINGFVTWLEITMKVPEYLQVYGTLI